MGDIASVETEVVRMSEADVRGIREAVRATVTVEEAARILGVGRSLAYEQIRAGAFPCPVIRIGTRYVISRQALDHVLAVEAPA